LKRRDFITLFGAAAAWPLATYAQQAAAPVVGYLGHTSAEADAYLIAAFRNGLAGAGFDEGRNIAVEYVFAERDVSRLPALAAELVGRKVTVVFTGTTVSALAMKAATSTIPIVFAIGADPVRSGLVASLNRPGGNLTGVSFFTAYRQAGDFVVRILKGTNPADLPVQQVTKFEFVINLKTAKALGVSISDNLLSLADEVIE
jgi:putative tryptophan/tyrosine transport system substrate-binding protein